MKWFGFFKRQNWFLSDAQNIFLSETMLNYSDGQPSAAKVKKKKRKNLLVFIRKFLKVPKNE